MAKLKAVAYYRVSTAKQGASGLGLEAQQEAVRGFCKAGKLSLMDEVTEIESGKNNERPALASALALCRVHGATLIIAKLDRLARNVHFVSGLMESGIEFTAVDFPQANKLTIHLLASVAEHEATLISQRTKAALAAAKARGTRLGGDRGKIASQAHHGARKSALVRQAKAQSRAADLRPILEAHRAAAIAEGSPGHLRDMAAYLNGKGIPGPRGGMWHGNSVRRVMAQNT